MNAKTCHVCGLNNFGVVETCKRCGGKLLSGLHAAEKARQSASSKPALTACSSCGQVVARHAADCPHCGKRRLAPTATRIAMLFAVIGILGATLFYGC